MRIMVDTENNAVYMRLDESKIMDSEEVRPGVILDYDENNMVIGIELLHQGRKIISDIMKNLHIETR
jgi:uncharacterized protein YuzE